MLMIKCDTIAVIEELINQKVGVAGFNSPSWSRGGNIPDDGYLRNGDLLSNVNGIPICLTTARLIAISFWMPGTATFKIRVFKHPTPFTTLGTPAQVTTASGGYYLFTTPPTVTGADRLGIQIIDITSGLVQNAYCMALTSGVAS